ncbi:unnamed protein product [Urochloa humidicola]
MKVKLQAREMWDAVKYGDVGRHEDRRALEALVAAVPPELGAVLATKLTAKDAWDAIAAARIGSEHARRSTLHPEASSGLGAPGIPAQGGHR